MERIERYVPFFIEKVLDFFVRTVYIKCADRKEVSICPIKKVDLNSTILKMKEYIFVSPKRKRKK